MGNKLSIVKRRQAVYIKLGERDEEWSCQTSSMYDLLPGHCATISIVNEELKLENSDKSPTFPYVSPTNSGNILHFNANFRTAENQVCERTPLTQNRVPVTNESKKDPLRRFIKQLGINYKFKLYHRATVFIPRKYLVSSLRKVVGTNKNQQNKLNPSVQVPTGTSEMPKMDSVTSEPDTAQGFSAGRLKDLETFSVANNVQLNPNAREFRPQLKKSLNHTCASSDMGTKKISVFEPLTIETSFKLAPYEVQYCYRAFEDVLKATFAAHVLQKLSNARSAREPVIVGSHHQFSSSNVNPVTSKFCSTPGWKGHDKQGCNVVPETTEPNTVATMPDTQQQYWENYAFTYSPHLQHRFWPKMPKKDS